MDNPSIQVYLTDLSGTNYYVATKDGLGVYSIRLSSTVSPILTLPKSWDKMKINWKRDTTYMGVFRFQTEGFTFVDDARAILLNLFYAAGGGIQANCIMRVDQFIDVVNGYETAYAAEIDFSTIVDNKYNQPQGTNNPQSNAELEANTLDSQLYQYLESFGDTQFNVPVFYASGSGWIVESGVDWLVHDGIKLLYSSSYVSSANPSVTPPVVLNYTNTGLGAIGGYNGGEAGAFHTIPSFTQYNIVQNNGTTTFIGNDILQPFLLQGNQNPGANAIVNEINFSGINNSQPFTRSNYSLKNLLVNESGSIDMWVSVTGQFSTVNGIGNTSQGSTLDFGEEHSFIRFVLWEIDSTDTPPIFFASAVPFKQYVEVYTVDLGFKTAPYFPTGVPAGQPVGYFDTSGSPTSITLSYGKVYVFGIIYDGQVGGPPNQNNPFSKDTSEFVSFQLTNLQFSLYSKYDYGSSGVPIPAASLNASVFPIMRPSYLLNKLATYLPTTTTDAYGFPVPVATAVNGQSTFLSDTGATPQGDAIPAQIGITSAYCIHDLQGQSYVSISINQLFNFFKKVFGCGMSIDPDGITLRIEKLSHYFQNTMIMNLDDYQGVANLSVKPFNDLLGANLKLGYTKQDTNSDFGIEVCNSELYFNTPAWKVPNTIDWEETDILTEPYATEKIRAQQTSQPVGASFDPANPSSDNQLVAFYCQPTQAGFALPFVPNYAFQPYDPDNNPIVVTPYQLTQRNGVPSGVNPAFSPCAQNIDSTAATAPYMNGFYYPDTMFNNELSPCRALQRDGGALLHSILDLMDADTLTFRNSSVMQYNNVELGLSGTESNLRVGASATPVTEFSDKAISALPAKLFRPFIFTIDTVAPVNMWQIMNTNPNGYIQFTWKGVIFKGFVWSIDQMLAASGKTSFELIAHPDTTNAQLINA